LTNLYEHRKFQDAFERNVTLAESFDLEHFVGLNKSLPHFYHEIFFRFDTRNLRTHFLGGIKLEGHGGVSYGCGENRCAIFKTGIDFIKSIPVIQQNRVFVPRLSFNMIKNLKDEIPIPFIDYPQPVAFRGVATRKLIRTDKYSLVQSLEYQWPLSFNLGGHFFFDQLLVTRSLKHFTIKNAPWAIGIGVDFHSIDGELARAIAAYGSEGWYFNINIGWNIF